MYNSKYSHLFQCYRIVLINSIIWVLFLISWTYDHYRNSRLLYVLIRWQNFDKVFFKIPVLYTMLSHINIFPHSITIRGRGSLNINVSSLIPDNNYHNLEEERSEMQCFDWCHARFSNKVTRVVVYISNWSSCF